MTDVFKPVNELLSGEQGLRNWAEKNNQRVGANADEMVVGEIEGEQYFVKQNLPESDKAAHLAAAPIMEQFDHAPEIFYDLETEEIAISKLGTNARSSNSAVLSDQLYDSVAPADEDAFYEVAAERWILGDTNVYDNILIESLSPKDILPGRKREVYLHDFDHAGKYSSEGRMRGFREAFEYAANEFGIDFSYQRFKREIGRIGNDLDIESYRQQIDGMEEAMRDDLYDRVLDHSQNIESNMERAHENF